mmetsp:Transcript_11921/g.22734  ORF Transcript_11921/g.22734 Transcript_11921/m.22734 type:complete len:84 (+) Transcript_11921:1471-1722(+)
MKFNCKKACKDVAQDNNNSCARWVSEDKSRCAFNGYVTKNCKKSCRNEDVDVNCATWVAEDHRRCRNNAYTKGKCKRSCLGKN